MKYFLPERRVTVFPASTTEPACLRFLGGRVSPDFTAKLADGLLYKFGNLLLDLGRQFF